MDAVSDRRDDTPQQAGAVEVMPPPVVVEAPSPQCPAGQRPLILGRLLQMADGYRAQRAFKQALAMYFRLVDEHGESREGQQACERLLEIAAEYEAGGQLRQARSIYERLL